MAPLKDLLKTLGILSQPGGVIWYNGCMNKDRLNRLLIGKMKNYRLSQDYKDFMSKVGNRYKEDYIERHDPNDEIPPVTVKENVYPIEHVYLDGTPFK